MSRVNQGQNPIGYVRTAKFCHVINNPVLHVLVVMFCFCWNIPLPNEHEQ